MSKVKTILAIILSILALVGLIGLTGCYTLKHYLNSETIKKIITDNDFSKVLNNVYEENKELLDKTKEVFEVFNIPENAISEVINSDATKNFIGIYAANSVGVLLGEEEQKSLTKEDLKSLIKDNLDIVQRNMPSEEKEFLENYENKAYEYLDIHGDEIISYFPDPKEILKDADQNEIKIYQNISLKDVLAFINFISNSTFLIIFALGILLILLLIYLLKRKVRWAKYYTFIFGTYTILMTMIDLILTTFIKNIFNMELKEFASLVNYVIDGASKMLLTFIISGGVIMVVCLIFYFKKRKFKNEKVSD